MFPGMCLLTIHQSTTPYTNQAKKGLVNHLCIAQKSHKFGLQWDETEDESLRAASTRTCTGKVSTASIRTVHDPTSLSTDKVLCCLPGEHSGDWTNRAIVASTVPRMEQALTTAYE